MNCIAEGATERQVQLVGNGTRWIGGELFDGASAPNVPLFEFNGATSVWIDGPYCHEYGTGGAFKFTTNGQASTIKAHVFDSGSNQATQGSPHEDIKWSLGLGGATALGSAAYNKRQQYTFTKFTPGTVPNNTLFVEEADGLLKLKDNNGTTRRVGTPSEEEVASANTISVSARISTAKLTGTTEVKKINATFAGHRLTLRFGGGIKVINGENLKLAGNFSGNTSRTLTLVCDGTNWEEVSRVPTLAVTGPEALVERAAGSEFEPSATRSVMVSGFFESPTATRTKVLFKVEGVVVTEAVVSVAATGVSTTPFFFYAPAGSKWKWEKVEGTVNALKTSYTVT